MKGVMSNSRGKETYVVIFLRSLAECSNRWGWPEREDESERGREWEVWGLENGKREGESGGRGENTYLDITGIIITTCNTAREE